MHLDEEREVELHEDALLGLGVLHLVLLNDDLLVQYFHRVDLLRVLLSHQKNLQCYHNSISIKRNTFPKLPFPITFSSAKSSGQMVCLSYQ